MNHLFSGDEKRLEHDAYKSWKNKKTLNLIKYNLTQLTILLRTQTQQDHTVGSLHFDRNRKINENPEKRAGPIDIKASLQNISAQQVQKNIAEIFSNSDLEEEDKKMYQGAVNAYIRDLKRQYLQHFKSNPQQQYYYTLHKEKKISEDDMYICLCLVNFLKPHKGTLTKEGEITQEGLKLIHRTLIETKLAYAKGKEIGAVFRDGDYMALLDAHDHGVLQNYVDVIKYLLDKEAFYPYGKQTTEEQKIRARDKSNFIDLWYSFHRIDFSKKAEITDFHNISVDTIKKIIGTRKDIQVLERIKEEASAARKSHGRTQNIRDHSGICLLYDKDISQKEDMDKEIEEIMKKYYRKMLPKTEEKNYMVEKIEVSNNNVVKSSTHDQIILSIKKELREEKISIKARESNQAKDQFLTIEELEKKIESLESQDIQEGEIAKFSLPPEVKIAYAAMTLHVPRGSNGAYRDYKFIHHVKYQHKGQEHKTFGQEIMFTNTATGLADHNILDLEKDIFAYCKSNQDMSLNTLRQKTAKTIKVMAFETKTRKAKNPNLSEDTWMFNVGNGKKISLLELDRYTEENQEDMRTLIAYILNSFLQGRKLIHIYADEGYPHTRAIYPQDLIFGNPLLKNRFTTSDVIRSAAFSKQIDASKYISLYHEGKYIPVSVEGLIDAIAAGYIANKHRDSRKEKE